MKLYSTIDSDRAGKKQGGNKFIDINLFVARGKGSSEDSVKIANILLERKEGGYHLYMQTREEKKPEIIKQFISDIELQKPINASV